MLRSSAIPLDSFGFFSFSLRGWFIPVNRGCWDCKDVWNVTFKQPVVWSIKKKDQFDEWYIV